LNISTGVKDAAPGVPVGYVDAYFQVCGLPAGHSACDVLLANCYPFWEGCPAEHALLYMKDMYRRAVKVAAGKPVIISETGWPNVGSATGVHCPPCATP
jgi:exo-beta-1,3-glucanase (GH17 family)